MADAVCGTFRPASAGTRSPGTVEVCALHARGTATRPSLLKSCILAARAISFDVAESAQASMSANLCQEAVCWRPVTSTCSGVRCRVPSALTFDTPESSIQPQGAPQQLCSSFDWFSTRSAGPCANVGCQRLRGMGGRPHPRVRQEYRQSAWEGHLCIRRDTRCECGSTWCGEHGHLYGRHDHAGAS